MNNANNEPALVAAGDINTAAYTIRNAKYGTVMYLSDPNDGASLCGSSNDDINAKVSSLKYHSSD
jgi:hypothetical protein